MIEHVFLIKCEFLLGSLCWRVQDFWHPRRSGSGRDQSHCAAEAKSLEPSSGANLAKTSQLENNVVNSSNPN